MAAEVIAGTYLDISKVTVPSEAEAGTTIRAKIEITNPSSIHLKYVSPRVEGNDVPAWSGAAVTLYAGHSTTWTYTFTMPNKSVSFDVKARYWGIDDKWHTDDTKRVSVSLAVLPPTEWVEVTRTFLDVTVFTPAVEWVEVTRTSLDVTVFTPAVEWVEVTRTSLDVAVFTPAVEWVEVAEAVLAVALPGVPPPPPPPPGIPDWAIIGGAAAGAAGVAYLATRKKT